MEYTNGCWGARMTRKSPDADLDIDLVDWCVTCGVAVPDARSIGLGGEILCEDCAEERLDDVEQSRHPPSHGWSPPHRRPGFQRH